MPVSDNDVKKTLSENKLSAEALERLTAFFSILIEVDRELKLTERYAEDDHRDPSSTN